MNVVVRSFSYVNYQLSTNNTYIYASTQYENVKIKGADFTNVYLPRGGVREFCKDASGTNPFTNRETRETLECDYI